MSKLFLLFVIAVFAVSVNAEGFGNFGLPNVGLFQFGFPGFPNFQIPPMNILTPDDIKNLKPKDGNTVVNGAYVSRSSSMDMVNGVPVRKVSTGRVVTNAGGDVTDTSY